MKNNKKVYFIPTTKQAEILDKHPQPSKYYIPKWYKDMKNETETLDGRKIPSAKMCIPFLDSFTTGYTQELPADIEFIFVGIDPDTGRDLYSYKWSGEFRPVSSRGEELGEKNIFPKFDGYSNSEFHWNSVWEPKTPKGYSTIYFHPNNRLDLPFHTLTGIIDTDKWSIGGPVPFLLKSGFSGIIPAGTPIYQFVFIKRDKWKYFKEKFNDENIRKNAYKIKRFLLNGYKKIIWQKKEYL